MATLEQSLILAPEIPDDLPEYIEVYLTNDEEPPTPPIDLAEVAKLAPRLARHWGHTRERIARIEAMYKAEVDRLTLWRDAAVRPLKAEQTRTERLLGTLHYLLRQVDHKLRTWTLPGLAVKVQHKKAAWVRTTDDAEADRQLVAAVKPIAPDFIKTEVVEKPMWSALSDDLQYVPATDDAPARAVVKSTGAVITLEALSALGIEYQAEHFTEPVVKPVKVA